jgi:hypothetical protein
MRFLKNIFRKRKPELDDLERAFILNDTDRRLIEEFSDYDDNWRVKEIIILAETGDSLYFRVMQYAILLDRNKSVRFAALKRIHFFEGHPDLKPMLLQMGENKEGNKFEPYLSMALSRLGLISIEEFESKINGR